MFKFRAKFARGFFGLGFGCEIYNLSGGEKHNFYRKEVHFRVFIGPFVLWINAPLGLWREEK
jgi:hypothetical protein